VEITEKSFWEEYWGEIKLPNKINLDFKNDRVIAKTISKNVPKAKTHQIALEIGCAPGKWMVFLYEQLNYSVYGFEYLDIAASKTIENLRLCEVPEDKFNIITADFLTQIPEPRYDLVISLGFMEHFDNYKDIFQKHLDYTTNDGYVVIGFPSFRGLNYYCQLLIDKLAGTEIILNHNISMMDKKLMEEMISESNKELLFIDYVGGFEAGLFNANDVKNPLLRFPIKVVLKLLSILFRSSKNKYISSYLMFVVKNG